MRRLATASALALAAVVPSAALAQELSVTTGFTLTSRYLANGLPQSDGPAFQPYVEAEVNGFYAGIWASNTSRNLVGARAEIDLYFGYRNEVGRFSYDLGYARYLYRSPSSNCCGEIILDMGVAVTEQIGVGVRFAHDPKASVTNSRLYANYAVNEKFGLDAMVGRINKGGHRYWSVGGSYAVTDNVSLSLAWHDTNIDKGRIVASMDVSFSLR
ncbi:MAG: TorF family putative porin [Gemmobacter sp.]